MASAAPLFTSGLAVGRARLAGPGASRALLETALGEVALDRLGLGPEELLYVPRLIGPGRLRVGATRHFAHGLGQVLGDIAARAERDPVGGRMADQPCRFSSRAAFAAWLIVCVLDAAEAEATAVVRAATGRASPQDWWHHELLGAGRILVPVLARLVEAGRAVQWLGRLDASEIARATAALADDYALAFARIGDGTSRARAARPMPAVPPSGDASGRGAHAEVVAACEAIAARGASLAALPVAARRLIVAAIVLTRGSGVPRDRLAQAIARHAEEGGPTPPPTGATHAAIPQASAVRNAGDAQAPRVSTGQPRGSAIVAAHDRAPAAPPVTGTTGAPARAADLVPAGATVRTERRAAQGMAEPRAIPAAAPHVARAATAGAPGSRIDAVPVAPQTAFDTAFGGVAFLVNAFLAMGLYPDFTRPRDTGLAISPLALVDRLGLHWFGARYRRDPLHRWIARAAPRGALPRRWRVDQAWLPPFANGHARHDGSTLWHAAGFPLANRIAAVPAWRLARALGIPPGADAFGTAPRDAPGDPRWLECLALFLAARLRRAAPDDALTPAALAIPARVVIGEARLDLHFPLAALPIALRIAGLDRDPGWLPTEGRDLRFHFA